MKARRHLTLVATFILFTLISISSQASSSGGTPVGNRSTMALISSELTTDIAIQFPDYNFETAVRRIIHKPTGDILKSNVAWITSIEVADLDIADLTGIEHFTALEKLDCSENRLATLDVSQNAALEELSCSINNLTTLDVSHNAMLKKLSCRLTGVESLNLDGAYALEWLGLIAA